MYLGYLSIYVFKCNIHTKEILHVVGYLCKRQLYVWNTCGILPQVVQPSGDEFIYSHTLFRCFTENLDFTGMEIDVALRSFLSKFRIPVSIELYPVTIFTVYQY